MLQTKFQESWHTGSAEEDLRAFVSMADMLSMLPRFYEHNFIFPLHEVFHRLRSYCEKQVFNFDISMKQVKKRLDLN